jgi:hypothetical protein
MMTKTVKAVIFFIDMRIAVKRTLGQLFMMIALAALYGCTAKKDDNLAAPPPTSPLSRDYIGFGVITSSFTHVTAEPAEDSASLGYLRRGSLVRITRRQLIKTDGAFTSWVLTEPPGAGGNQSDSLVRGWLKEEVMEIYDSEDRAKTAAETILK